MGPIERKIDEKTFFFKKVKISRSPDIVAIWNLVGF